jgi:hypothetical protein
VPNHWGGQSHLDDNRTLMTMGKNGSGREFMNKTQIHRLYLEFIGEPPQSSHYWNCEGLHGSFSLTVYPNQTSKKLIIYIRKK